MSKKSVLYVEDYPTQRNALHLMLEYAGFEVESAGTVAKARVLLNEKGKSFDVMLLDMKLEKDPDHKGTTGAQLAIEYLKREKPVWRPEFLILSAYKELEYFEHALQLGVAAYLYKGDYEGNPGNEEVIQHVRALALRRALSVERPEVARDIADIAFTSASRFDALKRFCARRLVPELKSCLGMHFFVLLKDSEGIVNETGPHTIYCGGDYEGWPEYDEFYDRLQALAHANSNDTVSAEIEKKNLPEPKDPIHFEMLDKLEGSILLPIAVTNDVRLTIGITTGRRDSALPGEDPKAMIKVLGQYFRSQSIAVLLELLVQVKERITEQKARLRETAHICLYFGQEQRRRLKQVEADANGVEVMADFLRKNQAFRNAKSLAEEAYSTGNDLKGLSEISVMQQSFSQGAEPMAGMIRAAWQELQEQGMAEGIELEVEGDCMVRAEEEDLWLIVVRLLQLFAQRRWETEEGVAQRVRSRCGQMDETAEIVLEDRSRRLPTPLRKRLFAPMTLATPSQSEEDSRLVNDILSKRASAQKAPEPDAAEETRPKGPGLYLALYLAKVLVEVKYGGELLDCSDEMAAETGHRFVMKLPAATARAQAPAGA